MMGGKAARPSGTPAQARPAEDPTIDFNNVEGRVGEIDPEVVRKQIEYIKIRHRSEDTLDEWNRWNYAATFDKRAQQDLERLALLDIYHQYSLQKRCGKVGVKGAGIADCQGEGVLPPHPLHSAEHIAKQCGYNEYDIARSRLNKKVDNVSALEAEDDELGFPQWQPGRLGPRDLAAADLVSSFPNTSSDQKMTDSIQESTSTANDTNKPAPKGKRARPSVPDTTAGNVPDRVDSPLCPFYISSIDRWHTSVLSKRMCTKGYEHANVPLMIEGLIEEAEKEGETTKSASDDSKDVDAPVMGKPGNAKYPAHFWTPEYLANTKFAEAMFRLGDDDDGRVLRAKLKVFLQYMQTNTDDSPLYLFEDNIDRCPVSQEILKLYKVPKYFANDLLLACMPKDNLPPYNWLLIGAKRSGTRMHLDPRSTSAWNMSVTGRKRWVLFRPGVPMNVAKGHVVMTEEEVAERREKGNPQCVYFFDKILPRLRKWIADRERLREIRLRAIHRAEEKGDRGLAARIRQKVARELRRINADDLAERKAAANDALSSNKADSQGKDGETNEAVEAAFWPKVTANERDLLVGDDAGDDDVDFNMKAASKSGVEEGKAWKKRAWNELDDGYGMMEFIQYPGETILVPSGWWHAVINIDNTVAYTQNFTNLENFVPVWRHMRQRNRGMARRWLVNLQRVRPDVARLARAIDEQDRFTLSPFKPHPMSDKVEERLNAGKDKGAPLHGDETSAGDVTESSSTPDEDPFEPSSDDDDDVVATEETTKMKD